MASFISNPFLLSPSLPRFSVIEPAHLTPAITSLLEKLEKDFEALETSLISDERETMAYDDVVPVVEKMQYPLGKSRIKKKESEDENNLSERTSH